MMRIFPLPTAPALLASTYFAPLARAQRGSLERLAPPRNLPTPKTRPALGLEALFSRLFDGDIWAFPLSRRGDFKIVTAPKRLLFSFYNSGTHQSPFRLASLLPEGINLELETRSLEGREERRFSLEALPHGEPDINAPLSFAFPHSSIILRLVGNRGLIFYFTPTSHYTESERLATSIFHAQDGSEHRQALTSVAKREISFTLKAASHQERATIEEMLRYGLRYSLLVPRYFGFSTLKRDALGKRLYLETEGRDFRVGEWLLIKPEGALLIARILQVESESITLDREVEASSGAAVYPLLRAYPPKSLPYSFLSHTSAWEISFKEDR